MDQSFLLPTPSQYVQQQQTETSTKPKKQLSISTSPLCTQLRSLQTYMNIPHFQGALQLHGTETCLMLVYSASSNNPPVVAVVEICDKTIVVISRRTKKNDKFEHYNRCMPYEIRANLVGVKALFVKLIETGEWVKKDEELISFYNETTHEKMAIPYSVNGSFMEVSPNNFLSSHRQLDFQFEKSPGRNSFVVWPNHSDFYNMALITSRLSQSDIAQVSKMIADEKELIYSSQYESNTDVEDENVNSNEYSISSVDTQGEEEVFDYKLNENNSDDDDDDDGKGVFSSVDQLD